MTKKQKSAGELLFEAHAASLGLDPVYEPKAETSRRRPDYLLPKVEVICEVEEFGMGQDDLERDRQLATSTFAEGNLDPWKRIRNVFERGSAQLKDFEGTWPLVVVLHCPPPVLVPLDTEMVLTALHGNTRIVLDADSLETKRVVYSPDHSVLRPDHKPYLSAVAVIERFRPLEEEMNVEAHQEIAGRQLRSQELDEIERDVTARVLRRHPDMAADHEAVRLRVMHNPYCTRNPLPIKVFTGAHDEHWHYDRRAQRFVLAWKGPGLAAVAS